MSANWRLLVDVGGTNVRFGRSGEDGALSNCQVWPVGSFSSFDEALESYLALMPAGSRFVSAVVAGAGPATEDAIDVTNTDWQITRAAVSRAIGHDRPVRLLNDLEAVALALPYLPSDEIAWADAVRSNSSLCGRMLAVNVGTGFGSACLIRDQGRLVCCPAESGHTYLGAQTTDELELFARIDPNGLSVEQILSGSGVRSLYQAVVQKSDGPATREFDFGSSEPAAVVTKRHFTEILGRTTANLTLATAAWDGIYLCGSVALAWADVADWTAFRAAFVGTGKMRQKLESTPVGVIRQALPAFVGMAQLGID